MHILRRIHFYKYGYLSEMNIRMCISLSYRPMYEYMHMYIVALYVKKIQKDISKLYVQTIFIYSEVYSALVLS